MNGMGPLRACVSWSIVAVTLAAPILVGADTHTRAAQLAAQLSSETLETFAAEDATEPGRFVAAMYLGGHLYAISAVHPAADFVRQEIARGDYRGVYSILSTTAHKQGRLFVEDYGALGLRPTREPNEPFDITRRDSTRQMMFDGNWKGQKLSEAEYRQRFATDEREYEEMLQVLAVALQKRTGV